MRFWMGTQAARPRAQNLHTVDRVFIVKTGGGAKAPRVKDHRPALGSLVPPDAAKEMADAETDLLVGLERLMKTDSRARRALLSMPSNSGAGGGGGGGVCAYHGIPLLDGGVRVPQCLARNESVIAFEYRRERYCHPACRLSEVLECKDTTPHKSMFALQCFWYYVCGQPQPLIPAVPVDTLRRRLPQGCYAGISDTDCRKLTADQCFRLKLERPWCAIVTEDTRGPRPTVSSASRS